MLARGGPVRATGDRGATFPHHGAGDGHARSHRGTDADPEPGPDTATGCRRVAQGV